VAELHFRGARLTVPGHDIFQETPRVLRRFTVLERQLQPECGGQETAPVRLAIELRVKVQPRGITGKYGVGTEFSTTFDSRRKHRSEGISDNARPPVSLTKPAITAHVNTQPIGMQRVGQGIESRAQERPAAMQGPPRDDDIGSR
jgi:hypothetical protein